MDTLPPEIITKVMTYLSFDDRRRMALVNRTFRYASMDPALTRQELFVYAAVDGSRRRFEDFKRAVCQRKRLCLKLIGTNRRVLMTMDPGAGYASWLAGPVGRHLVSLHLDRMFWLRDSFLDAITKCCAGLEELRLEKIGQLSVVDDRPRRPMLALRTVCFNRVGVSDACFNRLMACAPNVSTVGIENCQTYDWLDSSDATAAGISNVGLSDANIVRYLATVAGTLHSLRLNQCCHVFGSMRRSPALRLKSLLLNQDKPYLNTSRAIDFDRLTSALALQVSLQWLELNHLPCRLLRALSGLHELRHLTLNLTTDRDDDDECLREFAVSLRDMNRIRTLTVNRLTTWYFGHDAQLPAFVIPECAYESLTSLDCSFDADGLRLMLQRAGNRLSSLRIRNGEVLSAGGLRMLFENLTGLRRLWIDNCVWLDDDIMSSLPMSNLGGLICLKIFNANLSYRCLLYIKLLRLNILVIHNMSLRPCVALNGLSDFDYCLKTFSGFVPALTELELQLCCNPLMFKKLHFKSLFYNETRTTFISYFTMLKSLVLLYRYTY